MKQYLELLDRILTKGKQRQDRTGVGTIGLFGEQIKMDLSEGFPLLTTKKVHTKSIIYELLWFLKGDTNIKFLKDHGVTIWDEWADKDGELGPVYGEQWIRCQGVDASAPWFDEKGNIVFDNVENSHHARSESGQVIYNHTHRTVNQVKQAVDTLRHNPYSRRNIVSAWNVTQIQDMKLPPCHTLWQLYVEDVDRKPKGAEIHTPGIALVHEKRLSLHLYARSIDTFLGLPFNIASYAFLLHMFAHVTAMVPGDLIISFGDVHVYLNHLEQCKLQLSRPTKPLPTLKPFKNVPEMDQFQFEDFVVEGYDPHPAIKAPVAV
jgi:thymidylate synthase